MNSLNIEPPVVFHNPLDVIEELVAANEWPFERSAEEELVVEIGGRWCDYRLYFVWEENLSALQFSCQFDMKVPLPRRQAVQDLLAQINSRLWLGHFDSSNDEQTPMFRQTMLLRGSKGVTTEQVEDLVEIALDEAERYYPAFQFVIWGGKSANEAVTAAILETVGEA